MSNEFVMVLTTVNDEKTTENIINALLSRTLAACIQTMPIESHYLWEGNICRDKEKLLIIKTRRSCYQQIETLILDLHNYQVPQVLCVELKEGFEPYLTWLREHTKP